MACPARAGDTAACYPGDGDCRDEISIDITIPAALPAGAELIKLKSDVEASVILATRLGGADIDYVKFEVKSELGIAIDIPIAYDSISSLAELKEGVEAAILESTAITEADIAYIHLSPADSSTGAGVVATIVLKEGVSVTTAEDAKKAINLDIKDSSVTFTSNGEEVAVVASAVVEEASILATVVLRKEVDARSAYVAKSDVNERIDRSILVYTIAENLITVEDVAVLKEHTACEGFWSPCTASCGDKIYSITTQQSGVGVACPARAGDTAVCFPGDGDCPGLSCQ